MRAASLTFCLATFAGTTLAGSPVSKTLKPGKQALTFGIPRVLGIETATIKANGSWSLHTCEVAIQ